MRTQYAHKSLEKAEETLGYVLDIISEGVWDWNALNGHVERSPGWYRMLGYEVFSLDKNVYTWENLIHPEDYPEVMKHFEAYINGEIGYYNIQYRCKKSDGTYIWIEDSAKIVERTEDGQIARMIGAHTNIDEIKLVQEKLRKQTELLLTDNASLESLVEKRTKELEELNKKLEENIAKAEHNAAYDVLTETYNRRMFEEIFAKEMNRAQRYSLSLSIVLLDIDDFKLFNDEYGHKTGDEVLCAIADILKNNIRESDTLARWGGEEFVILFPNIPLKETAEKADMIRKKICNSLFAGDLKVTCSFGVTSYEEGDDMDAVFVRADNALYRAKELNKNNVQSLRHEIFCDNRMS
jgi:diguanylate cyclase (GGDEF)-like protein/PAS domain S-box-containing protein